MYPPERLAQLKEKLREAFGERLKKVILYGSYARDDAADDSDVDLLVVLEPPVSYCEDMCSAIDAIYPLVLEWGTPIHPVPAEESAYESGATFFLQTVRKEGVSA